MITEKPKFTPAPWFYKPSEYDDWGTVKDARGWIVANARDPELIDASVHRRNKTDPYIANGNLISAAPEMYGYLEELVEFCKTLPQFQDDVPSQMLIYASATLKKARGEA